MDKDNSAIPFASFMLGYCKGLAQYREDVPIHIRKDLLNNMIEEYSLSPFMGHHILEELNHVLENIKLEEKCLK